MRIYAHGIAVEPGDGWDAGELPLVATTDLPIYAHFTVTLVDLAEASLNERIVSLDQHPGPRRSADYFEERDLRNGLLAMAYHVQRLAMLYVEVSGRFEEIHPGGTAVRGNVHMPPIYYEADAFLTAARRWYETLLRLLWKHYGSGRRPGTFHKLFDDAKEVPADHVALLDASWRAHGTHLNDYRNCLIHHDPLDDGGKTAWTAPRDGRWGTTVKLPANPRARRREAFDFDNGPDVLTYAHALVCHLTEVAEATDQLPAIVADRHRPYGRESRDAATLGGTAER